MNGGSGRGAAPARLRISRDFTSASAQLTAAQYRGPSSRPDPARRTTPLPPTLLALSLSLSVSPPLSLVSTGDRLLLFLSLYLLSFLVETSISSTSYVLLGPRNCSRSFRRHEASARRPASVADPFRLKTDPG